MASKSALPPLQLFLHENFTPLLLWLRAGIFYVEKSVLRLSCFPPVIPSEHLLLLSFKNWKSCSTKFFIRILFSNVQIGLLVNCTEHHLLLIQLVAESQHHRANIKDAIFLNSIYFWVSIKAYGISCGISINCNWPGLDFSPSLVHETLTTKNFLRK